MKKYLVILPYITLAIIMLLKSDYMRLFLINKLKFGWILSDITIRIIPFFLLLLSVVSLIKVAFKPLNKNLVVIVSALISFGVNFAINPIYVDDYGVIQSQNKNLGLELIESHFPNLLTNNESVVVSFFTSTCPFCKSSAISFELNKKAGKQPKTIILFPSTEEDANKFLKQNGAGFDYSLITDKEFLDNAGNRFPSVFLIKNGKVENHWIGSEINYSVLDYLRELAD